MWDSAAQQRAMRYAAPPAESADAAPGASPAAAAATDFPVPPLDLPHYHGVGPGGGTEPGTGVSNTATSSREVTGA
jgi:hypothetical protein